MKCHLHHALLVLRRQHGDECRGLKVAAVRPLIVAGAASVPAVPLRQCRARLFGRAAMSGSLRLQRREMLRRRLVWVGAYEIGDGPVDGAVAPRAALALRPRVRELPRRVAARVALVVPVFSVEAVVLRREEIHGQWRNTGRR